MQSAFIPKPDASLNAQRKPHLTSLDSGQECSLAHLEEVCRIIELAEFDDRELKGYLFDDSCLLISE
jgi:hypothetical protein